MRYFFLNEAQYIDLENGKFELWNDLIAVTPYGVITVPKGYITDLASIPWIAQCIIPKLGKQNRSSVVHDYLYEVGSINGKKITREIADKIYFGLMKSRKVSAWNRHIQYRALRMFGFIAWNKYKKERNNGKN